MRSFNWFLGILITLGIGAAMSVTFNDWVTGMAIGAGTGIAIGLLGGSGKSKCP
jgi:hypothetical protein